MKEFRELTLMHQEMCHRLVETSKACPNDPKRYEILNDVMALERMVKEYMGAEMKNYMFVRDGD